MKIIDLYYNIKYFFLNLIKYRRFLWEDRSYDSYYIFYMLREKLSHDVGYYEKYGNHVHVQKDIDNMKLCVKILNRIIEDDYHEKVFKHHNKKWGEPEFRVEDVEDRAGYCELFIDRENVKSQEDKEQERKEFRKLSKHEGYLKQQDVNFLFNFMSKHIKSWWN